MDDIKKHGIGLLLAFIFNTTLIAANLPIEIQPLDEVNFKLTERAWVSTEQALLKVNVHATLQDTNVIKIRANILNNLQKIASGEWHITQFDRSQDNSGLEKLLIQAELRINESKLTQVYKQTKDLSKPGVSYEIAGVEFKPSIEDLEKTRVSLREKIYQDALHEIERLNKIYTNQSYTLNNIVFFENAIDQEPRILRREMVTTMAESAGAPPPEANVSLSNELILTAIVRLASNRPLSVSNQSRDR